MEALFRALQGGIFAVDTPCHTIILSPLILTSVAPLGPLVLRFEVHSTEV